MTVSELLEDPAALSRYEYLVAKAFVQVGSAWIFHALYLCAHRSLHAIR